MDLASIIQLADSHGYEIESVDESHFRFRPKVVHPDGLNVKGVGTSKLGFPIYEVSSSANDLITHDDSGDAMSISADGKYLAIMDTLGTTDNGDWYALELETGKLISLSTKRGMNGNSYGCVNANIIWHAAGARFWRVNAGAVELCEINGESVTVVASGQLPSDVSGPRGNVSPGSDPGLPDSGQAARLSVRSYQSEFSSGENTFFLGGKIAIDGKWETLFLPVEENGGHLGFGEPVWLVDAYHEGFNAGQVVTIDGNAATSGFGFHNVEVGLGGIFGGLQTGDGKNTQQIKHWIPFDGSTMVQIEPGDIHTKNLWVHPTCDSVHMIYGTNPLDSGTNTIEIRRYSTPPKLDDMHAPAQNTIARSQLVSAFTDHSENQLYFWHGDVRNGKFVFSVLGHNGQSTHQVAIFVAELPTEPGLFRDVTCVVDGLDHVPAPVGANAVVHGRYFYHTARPTISADGKYIAWHQVDRQRDKRCVRYTQLF